MVVNTWIGVDRHSRERCTVDEDTGGVTVRGAIEDDTGGCTYVLRATAEWEFTELDLTTADRELVVRRTPSGWTVDGALRAELAAAHEIDLSASPVTNTLPIRRLGLAVGASAEIVTAYVRVPELDVTPDPQRYTRLDPDRYLYESLDSDFRRTITVDHLGWVIEYPGLFRRIDP